MKFYTTKQKGFTLIELLVVVSIIGMLSSVVLVSLKSARDKARDTRVLSDIRQLKLQIETDRTGSDYLGPFYILSNMTVISSMGSYQIIRDDIIANGSSGYVGGDTLNPVALSSNSTKGLVTVTNATQNGLTFSVAPTAYALYGRLSTGSYFCMDSTGGSITSLTPVKGSPIGGGTVSFQLTCAANL